MIRFHWGTHEKLWTLANATTISPATNTVINMKASLCAVTRIPNKCSRLSQSISHQEYRVFSMVLMIAAVKDGSRYITVDSFFVCLQAKHFTVQNSTPNCKTAPQRPTQQNLTHTIRMLSFHMWCFRAEQALPTSKAVTYKRIKEFDSTNFVFWCGVSDTGFRPLKNQKNANHTLQTSALLLSCFTITNVLMTVQAGVGVGTTVLTWGMFCTTMEICINGGPAP